MRRHPILKAILGAYIAWSAWHWIAERPVHPPDGVLAQEEPRRSNIVNGERLDGSLDLRPSEVVTLRGELVDGLRNDGRWIKTSLVRDDSGPGACEVLLVTDIGS
jgi:hypothetical protein